MHDLAAHSEFVQLPAGNMEFAIRGNGRPVLVFHSAPGGYDQSLALGGFLEEAGFQIIAPSRPGYLRTPLATGPSAENQAAAAAQLLDHLEIPRVAVLGFGWGGPPAVEFARRFPDRTSALVLVSGITSETPPAPGTPLPLAITEKLGGDSGSKMFTEKATRNPGEALSEVIDLTSNGDAANRSAWRDAVLQTPGATERFHDIILSLSPLSCREEGLQNDLAQPLPSLRELSPPLLIVHGGMDKAAPLGKIDKAGLNRAEVCVLPEEGHLIFPGRGAASAEKRILDFLDAHSVESAHRNSNHAK